MEQKLNIAELLKDCPQGMELDCTVFEGLEFDGIVDNEYLPIRCRIKNPNGGYNVYNFTKYGCWFDAPFSKCSIFPKGKTTWEGFQRPLKDGDIIFTHANSLKVGLGHTWISIYQENCNGGVATYVDYAENENAYFGDIDEGKALLCMEEDILLQRLATEEEKAKLFKAIKAHGYKWNAETKTLEKLVELKFKVGDVIQDIDTYKVKITEVNIEDECYEYESMIAKGIGSIGFSKQDEWELVPNKFDINTLVPFESRVLVRDNKLQKWYPAMWGFYDFDSQVYPYKLIGVTARYCIPYNDDTKHLLGTTNDCDEFYKTWK